jgi:hypothetical protein
VALFLTGAALVLLAAALMHGEGAPRRGVGWTWLGVALAVGATIAGMAVWDPASGWPVWFPLLWLPALMVVAFPVPSAHAVVSVALAAGSLASLLTWSAELRGRTQLAQREVAGSGRWMIRWRAAWWGSSPTTSPPRPRRPARPNSSHSGAARCLRRSTIRCISRSGRPNAAGTLIWRSIRWR